jgi:hypothetical protein
LRPLETVTMVARLLARSASTILVISSSRATRSSMLSRAVRSAASSRVGLVDYERRHRINQARLGRRNNISHGSPPEDAVEQPAKLIGPFSHKCFFHERRPKYRRFGKWARFTAKREGPNAHGPGSTGRLASAANARHGAKGIDRPPTIGHRALLAPDARRQVPQGRLTVTHRRLPYRPHPLRQRPVGRRRRAGR